MSRKYEYETKQSEYKTKRPHCPRVGLGYLVAVVQFAVALPPPGAGAREAGGGARGRGRGRGLRTYGGALVQPADKLGTRRLTLLHLPQPCGIACCHGHTASLAFT